MLAERLTAQLLAGPPGRDPVAVTERLLAVQGQDPRGARLAIRARSRPAARSEDVDRALSDDRSLLITWLNRGTLHLVRSEDYPWLHALTAPRIRTANARRLREEGVSQTQAERGVQVIRSALADEGPLTRAVLAQRLAGAGVPTEGQALAHLLMLASLLGLAVRGPMIGRDHGYVLVHDWLGPPVGVDRERALAELARRYLAGHAPADDRDLARWAGLPLRDARAGLTAIAAQLRERPDGLLELRGRGPAAQIPPPRLLGPYDPVLLGWMSREQIIGSHLRIVTDNGLFRPVALVDGRAVGVWRLADGRVTLEPFARLPRATVDALAEEADAVLRYLGHTGTTPARA